ncbi:heme oxygenase [Cotesia typhae]|uniref:heme oxygenase n=1 Tax=Cotesia typhae TaxID=2053667 RepID=UPI003D68DC2E
MSENKKTFCDDMRKATRKIHAISDALVNAKLALGLHNNKIWADGLLIFYEIFKFLEKSIDAKIHEKISRFQFLYDLKRSQAIEDDLNYYLNKDWLKNYSPRPAVVEYIDHLKKLESKNSILIIAYIYHLYMGLLSGGIILRKKRQLMQKLMPFNSGASKLDGNHVTDFGELSIYELKKNVKRTMNEVADELDEDTKKSLIDESKKVFLLNNKVIQSVQESML